MQDPLYSCLHWCCTDRWGRRRPDGFCQPPAARLQGECGSRGRWRRVRYRAHSGHLRKAKSNFGMIAALLFSQTLMHWHIYQNKATSCMTNLILHVHWQSVMPDITSAQWPDISRCVRMLLHCHSSSCCHQDNHHIHKCGWSVRQYWCLKRFSWCHGNKQNDAQTILHTGILFAGARSTSQRSFGPGGKAGIHSPSLCSRCSSPRQPFLCFASRYALQLDLLELLTKVSH